MMLPPNLQNPSASQPMSHLSGPPQADMLSRTAPIKSSSVIQAGPTVYCAPPVPSRADPRDQRQARMEELAARVAEQQAAVMAAGLLDRADFEDTVTMIGPSMPDRELMRPEPEIVHSHSHSHSHSHDDKKKGKSDKVKKCIRTAAGSSWEDQSLLEWDADDFRIFCGDLGNEVNDDILARAFSRYPSFLKAKVVRDKRTGKTKGYGFVSFKDPNDYVRAMREMNGKYVGSRPIKLRKSMWKDRNIEVVRKKQKEKKKLGLR